MQHFPNNKRYGSTRETMSVHAHRRARALARLTLGCIASSSLQAGAAEIAAATQLPAVEVIGTTPLSGIGLDRDQIAAPVQSATDADIRRSQALELTDFLNRRFGSVHVNEMQG